jgi:HEAT repeat protein
MIQNVLQKLAEANGSPPAVEVARLSGLSPSDVATFREAWGAIPPVRRRAILQMAVELAENDVEMDFGDVFKACLGDPDETVRAVAIEGLWEDEEFRTADQLATMLRHDTAEVVRVAAALGLAQFALLAEQGKLYAPSAKRVREALVAAATDFGETIDVRRRAIEALGVFSDRATADLIGAAYTDADPKMRASAVYAMGRSCDERWLETILRELESESPEMRYEAARAAGELGSERAIVPLITLLEDEDLEVRLAAVGSLGDIGGDIARKALQRCAQSENAAVRSAAIDALGELDLTADPLSISPFLRDSTRTI